MMVREDTNHGKLTEAPVRVLTKRKRKFIGWWFVKTRTMASSPKPRFVSSRNGKGNLEDDGSWRHEPWHWLNLMKWPK